MRNDDDDDGGGAGPAGEDVDGLAEGLDGGVGGETILIALDEGITFGAGLVGGEDDMAKPRG